MLDVNSIEINSFSAVMYNLKDDTILYEKNANQKLAVASLTKIVTAITIIDNNDDLTQKITVTEDMIKDLKDYAVYGFKPKEQIPIIDLLYTLIISSSADAAKILAIGTTGSIEKFSMLMNKETARIGAINSHFDNPVGMDSENNYSTAMDMAKILKYALKNSVFNTIFETKRYKSNDLKKEVSSTLYLYDYDTAVIKGAKTGFTLDSGRCLASTAIINNVPYLVIVLNAPLEEGLNIKDTLDLYNYFSQNYNYINIINNNQNLIRIKIKNGKKEEYLVKATEDVSLYLPNNYSSELTYQYKGIPMINQDIAYNTRIGEIQVLHGSDIIYTKDVYLDEKLKYHNYKADRYIFLFIIMLIYFLYVLIKVKKHYQ